MNKLASVIVLTYKNFENIKKNIESILQQDYEHIEILISDDGSENFDREYIEELLKKKKENIISTKIIKHNQNQGIVKNLNNAIKESKGQYIIPLSQDDCFYSRSSITYIVERLDNNLIVSGLRVIKENGKEVQFPTAKEIEAYKKSENKYEYILLKNNIFSGASTYYNKKIFYINGYFDEKCTLVEDFPYYLKFLRNDGKIEILEKKIIYYGKDGVSSSNEKNRKFYLDFFKIYKDESIYNKGYLKRYLMFLAENNLNRYNKKNYKIKKEMIKLKYIDIYIKIRLKKIKRRFNEKI